VIQYALLRAFCELSICDVMNATLPCSLVDIATSLSDQQDFPGMGKRGSDDEGKSNCLNPSSPR
jgi:hypothetical protein